MNCFTHVLQYITPAETADPEKAALQIILKLMAEYAPGTYTPGTNATSPEDHVIRVMAAKFGESNAFVVKLTSMLANKR